MVIKIDRIAESFVRRPVKFKGTTSSGEGKLYIASKNEKARIDKFFNSFQSGNKYRFDRQNFLEYLFSVEFEYTYNIFHQYNDADRAYWEAAVKTIRGLKDFYFDAGLFEDTSRLYIENNARDNIFYKYFREYVLPDITKVEIEDDGVKSDEFIFKIFLKSDLRARVEIAESEPGDLDSFDFNRIVYGAPGTGKSYKIEADSRLFGNNRLRVTFYPDYSYAKFVGSYKPSTYYKQNVGSSADKSLYFDSKSSTHENSAIRSEPVIDYVFTPGPFLQALLQSLKAPEPFLLMIEEINRANAASVFGEIFQLLDRTDGKSSYTVTLSNEAMLYLQDQLIGTDVDIAMEFFSRITFISGLL
ncbi:AAA family ATPase [Mucilaginibacter sp.]